MSATGGFAEANRGAAGRKAGGLQARGDLRCVLRAHALFASSRRVTAGGCPPRAAAVSLDLLGGRGAHREIEWTFGMDLDDVLQASENLNADINHGQLLPTINRDIVQVSSSAQPAQQKTRW